MESLSWYVSSAKDWIFIVGKPMMRIVKAFILFSLVNSVPTLSPLSSLFDVTFIRSTKKNWWLFSLIRSHCYAIIASMNPIIWITFKGILEPQNIKLEGLNVLVANVTFFSRIDNH
jgi:hypothetical protein